MTKKNRYFSMFYDFRIKEILTEKTRLDNISILFNTIEIEKSNNSTGFLISESELLSAKFLQRQNPNTIRLNRFKNWGLVLEILPENRGY
jgi:hypothetical protein